MFAAPSAPPTDLQVLSASPTSIAISWGRVPCQHRNAEITGYRTRVRYEGFAYLLGTTERMFTASDLFPRTSYTLEVQAFHMSVDPPAEFLVGPSVVTGTTTELSPGKYSYFVTTDY